MPLTSLTLYQRRVVYVSTKFFNNLPQHIAGSVKEKKQFVKLLIM